MKKLTILLALFLACAAPIVRAADKLEMQDVVSGKYAAQRVYGVNPLLDGEHYAQISNDGKRIVKYSFKDGKEVEPYSMSPRHATSNSTVSTDISCRLMKAVS